MKYFIYYVCLPVLFYPVYFLVANIIDTLLGDQQLINWLYLDSRSALLKIFIKDWISSLPVMYLIFYLIIMPLEAIFGKIFKKSMLPVYIASLAIVTGVTYTAGFRELGLLINTATVFFIITLYYSSQVMLFPQAKR